MTSGRLMKPLHPMARRSFLLAPLAFAMAAAGSRARAYDRHVAPDIARIIARGKLLVAAHPVDAPPFLYADHHGAPAGIDADLTIDIARRLGVGLEYLKTATSYDALPLLVAERKADVVISSLSRTFRRAMAVRFTQPYAWLRQTLMVNRTKTAQLLHGRDPLTALNAPDVVLGVLEDSSYVDFAGERFPLARLLKLPRVEALVAAVLAGEVHALMHDEGVAQLLNYPRPEAPAYGAPKDWALHVKTIPLPGAVDPIAMAVHPDDHTWLAWLDLYVSDRRDDGGLDHIIRRHMHERMK